MPNKKNNKSNNKQIKRTNKPKRRQKRSMGSNPSNISTGLAKLVCSNSNPFCPEANGAKLHDTNSTRSLTYQNRQLIVLTSDVAGDAAVYITPSAIRSYYGGTIVGNAVSNWNAANTNTFYSNAAFIGSYRVVSWGVKYQTTQAWTAATGTLVVSECNDFVAGATGQVISTLSNGVDATYLPLRDASFTCVGKARGMMSNEYIAIASTDPLQWTTFLICVDGATASTNLGVIELVVNYEWIPITTTGYNYFSSPAAPSIPAVMEGRAAVYTSRPFLERFKDAATSDYSWMTTAMNNLRTIGSGVSMGLSLLPSARGLAIGRQAMRTIMN